MLTLYHHSTSVCSAKVRIALHEKELAWDGRFVDILAGEQFHSDYRRLNPRALVPTLIDGDAVIIESTVINEYLDEGFPDVPLRPADSVARARMRVWTKLIDEKLHDACTVVTYVAQHRHRLLGMSPAEFQDFLSKTADPIFRERKRRWVVEGVMAPDLAPALRTYDQCLADMEAALADRPWLAGKDYSLADIAMTPYINRLAMLSFHEMWGARPRATDWFARIRERPSFPESLIQHIPSPLAREMDERGRAIWPSIREILAGDRPQAA